MCQQHPSTGSFDYSCGSAQGNYRKTVRHAVYGSSDVTELPKPLCPCRRAVPFMVDGFIQTLRGGLLAK